jgi:peptide/nickel transport system permease protein
VATDAPQHTSDAAEQMLGPVAVAEGPAVGAPAGIPYKRLPLRRRLWSSTIVLRASRVGMVGFTLVALWVFVAVFAPFIQRYDPLAPVVLPVPAGLTVLDLPAGSFPSPRPYRVDNPATPRDETVQGYVRANSGPSPHAWLGTDARGRDVYSRLVAGTRQVFVIAPASILLGAAIGIMLGLIAGFYGRWIDEILMRLLDAIIAFPAILLLLIVLSAVGASRGTVTGAIALAAIPGVARLARSMTLDLRNREYVAAARLRGESSLYIMLFEILPNARGPIIIDLTLRMAYAVFAIATLGFLGLGLPPPTPDWGTMVAESRNFIRISPWPALFPALAISTLVVGLNLMADGIRQESARYR